MKQQQTIQKKQDSTKNPMQQTVYFQGFSKLADHPYLEAQGIIGNHGILRRHSGDIIQARLKIGQPNDKYEQEADRVANLVMNSGENQLVGSNITKINHAVQGKSDGGEVSPGLESRIDSMKGGGQPLSASTRSFFETRFGTDFSRVRIHTDSRAVETTKSVNAKAFTVGKDLVFGDGQYSPATYTGKKLLAHELTHVVQQSQGRVKPTMKMEGTAINDNVELEKEADLMGTEVLNTNSQEFRERCDMVAKRSVFAKSNNRENSVIDYCTYHPNIQDTIQMKMGLEDEKIKVTEDVNKDQLRLGNGTIHNVDTMISDKVIRVFQNATEAMGYANGVREFKYMGDVKNTFVKLEKEKTYVLGEEHDSIGERALDVIKGVDPERFMYEPFMELPSTNLYKFPKTQDEIKRYYEAGGEFDLGDQKSKKFGPALENLVIKTMPMLNLVANFLKDVERKSWTLKKEWGAISEGEYKENERAAHYLTYAITIAEDIELMKYQDIELGANLYIVKDLYKAFLEEVYKQCNVTLKSIKDKKRQNPNAGMLELVTKNDTINQEAVEALNMFIYAYSIFAINYANQMGDKDIKALNLTPEVLKDEDFWTSKVNTAREIYMAKQLIKAFSNDYLIVGMGGHHWEQLQLENLPASDLIDKNNYQWYMVPDLLSINKKEMRKLWRGLKVKPKEEDKVIEFVKTEESKKTEKSVINKFDFTIKFKTNKFDIKTSFGKKSGYNKTENISQYIQTDIGVPIKKFELSDTINIKVLLSTSLKFQDEQGILKPKITLESTYKSIPLSSSLGKSTIGLNVITSGSMNKSFSINESFLGSAKNASVEESKFIPEVSLGGTLNLKFQTHDLKSPLATFGGNIGKKANIQIGLETGALYSGVKEEKPTLKWSYGGNIGWTGKGRGGVKTFIKLGISGNSVLNVEKIKFDSTSCSIIATVGLNF